MKKILPSWDLSPLSGGWGGRYEQLSHKHASQDSLKTFALGVSVSVRTEFATSQGQVVPGKSGA